MSLGLAQSSVYNSYIDTLVSIGIVVSTASGNDALDACTDSPGNSGSNINVGSHGYEETTCKKPMAYDSNYGACVDIMAPGMNIKSADYTSNTGKLFIYNYFCDSSHLITICQLFKYLVNGSTLLSLQLIL